MGALSVEFCGEVHEVDEGGSLTFGRSGDLSVDEANPYMHRLVGRFRHAGGLWWLDNLGSTIELVLVAETGSRTRLGPATDGQVRSVALAEPNQSVLFNAGNAGYRIEVATTVGAQAEMPLAPAGNETVGHGVVTLTPEERLLVGALARPLLLDPTASPTSLPANRAVAAELGWRITTYNRKLDRLCDRLRRAGVAGMAGERGAEAMNRRWALVTHAVSQRLVTLDDLPQPQGEVPNL